MRLLPHLVYILTLAHAIPGSDISEEHSSFLTGLSLDKDRVATMLFALPFRDLICRRAIVKQNELFEKVLLRRPELYGIQWQKGGPIKLAERLWTLQSTKSDSFYHKHLAIALRSLMKYLKIPSETIKEVQEITRMKGLTRSKRQHEHIKAQKGEASLKEAKRLERKREWNVRKAKDKKLGLNLPLIEYIRTSIEDPWLASPAEIHREALNFRCKYRSAKSFLGSLKHLWTTLGYSDVQVHRLNQDKRNLKYDSWTRSGSDRRSSEDCMNNQEGPNDHGVPLQETAVGQNASDVAIAEGTGNDDCDIASTSLGIYDFGDDDADFFSPYYSTQLATGSHDDAHFPHCHEAT